ncbi:NRDE family protein [Flagellimonas hymeniacidonis]|uniref:NRDE family protein n=1 Tax=Flagellimonas hymeniacidonis TaxID=2603628 RepID=A0A5C8V6U7_9FLAO|nr:NRDE family protein [Flagellimonas hymeniacidonis]TXN36859.1 NRDE family protein [Flagellimonas hymeniacidonis]
MCTVSFISRNNNYFITSNRDEHISRPVAFEPKEEIINTTKVLFPKDPKAGGTWFALNENGVVAVVLNGAFKKHESKGNYAKSRGLILLDVISASNPDAFIKEMDLDNIEPFTLVLFDTDKLQELRWDGHQKHLELLDKSQSHIWSSATLYDEEAIAHRANLFSKFIGSNTDILASDVVDFHSNNHEDYENGFIIDRNTGLKTFSVTQAILGNEESVLKHLDLFNNKKYVVPFSPNQLVTK